MGKNVIGEEGRLKLALDIEDTKRGKIKVMAFGEVGERILGIKTTELKAMIDADDPNLKSLFVDVMGKKMLFTILKQKKEKEKEYLPTIVQATPEIFQLKNELKRRKL